MSSTKFTAVSTVKAPTVLKKPEVNKMDYLGETSEPKPKGKGRVEGRATKNADKNEYFPI
jgi:hypothetical protein